MKQSTVRTNPTKTWWWPERPPITERRGRADRRGESRRAALGERRRANVRALASLFKL